MPELRVCEVTKVFPDGTHALSGVSFAAPCPGVVTVLGPSGCGKSTLLRIIAGLEEATTGSVTLDGRPLDGVSPGRRDVGFVFQSYALYPHLTVAGNMELALEARGVPRGERERRVRETAQMLGIGELLERRPGQLSGGQQQRVALGRALARRPKLYLLDEPLSNLDALLRESMRSELKALFHRLDASVVYVTHDQAEAMSLSDVIVVMRAGRVLQCASPLAIYAEPETLFVATFVGSPRITVWEGIRVGSELASGSLRIPIPPELPSSERLCAAIRPEHVEVSEEPLDGGWPVEVTQTEALGIGVLLTLRAGEADARALAAPRAWPGRAWMRWPAEHIHWFDPETEQRIVARKEPRPRGSGG